MIKRKIILSPAEEIARRLTRTFILGILDPWTVDDLQFAINNKVLLTSLIKVDSKSFGTVKSIGQRVPRWAGEFTFEYVVEWLIENRPDFAITLHSPAGEAWLRNNINALRRAIWEDDTGALSPEEVETLQSLHDKYKKEVK